MRKTFPLVLILLITIALWALGVLAHDFPAPSWWGKFFYDIANLEGLFSPIAAFFSGLSAIATGYLIYLQIGIIEKQEKDTRRTIFENQIFHMFAMRSKIIDSLKYSDGENNYVGIDVFKKFYCHPLGGAKPPALAGGFSMVVVSSEAWTPTSTEFTAFFRSICTLCG